MKITNVCKPLILSVALLGTGFAVGMSMAQDKKPSISDADMDKFAKMMEQCQKYAEVTENHKKLEHKVGKWNGTSTFWMDPNMPPESSTCTTEYKWILDGRFLQSTTEGEFEMEPGNIQHFRGLGLEGYDNFKKSYVSLWVDNMGTGLMTGSGSLDGAGKTMTYVSEGPNFWTGGSAKYRIVETMTDANNWTMSMYSPGADGKEFKSVEIKYTRAN